MAKPATVAASKTPTAAPAADKNTIATRITQLENQTLEIVMELPEQFQLMFHRQALAQAGMLQVIAGLTAGASKMSAEIEDLKQQNAELLQTFEKVVEGIEGSDTESDTKPAAPKPAAAATESDEDIVVDDEDAAETVEDEDKILFDKIDDIGTLNTGDLIVIQLFDEDENEVGNGVVKFINRIRSAKDPKKFTAVKVNPMDNQGNFSDDQIRIPLDHILGTYVDVE